MSIGSIGGISATHINRTQNSLALLLEQLSTGQRITSASVDPAGLAVFNQLDTASGSTRQAIRNANDGISVVQTAESYIQRPRQSAAHAGAGDAGLFWNDQRLSARDLNAGSVNSPKASMRFPTPQSSTVCH